VTLDDFTRVGRVALDNIDTLLAEWFPNGVRQGREFCIGSMDGEAGQSLRICLTGEKAGVWSDFSADGEAGSDLISLYAAMHGLRAGKACAALAERFGITITPSDKTRPGASQAPLPAKAKTPDIRPPAQADNGVQAVSATKARTPWAPILPVPDDAGPYPKAHPVRGRPDASWEYRNEGGALLGVIYRFVTSDGGKEVLPCVFAEHAEWKKKEWRWLSFPEPRPLYLGGALRPELPLLVVEGEKCRDAAGPLLIEELDTTSWPGGGKAVKKADWSAIRDRDVILWSDADAKRYKENHERAGELMPEDEQPGMKAMLEIAKILEAQGNRIAFVDIPAPGEVEDGWDVADLIAAGAGKAEVLAWVTKLRAPPAEEVPPQDDDPDDGVPEWFNEHVDQQLATVSTEHPAGAGGVTPKQLREMLIQTMTGGVKGCRENVYTVMQNDARLIGLVGLDLFSGLQVKRKNTPWESEPGEWTESDDFMLGVYMSRHHGLLLASVGDIERGVAQAARAHSFNPVIDYFDRCKSMWDGQRRVQNALSAYWGAGDSEYLKLVSTMFFVGIVVRGYRPGVKHDHAPVFEGGQGRGKSTALKVMGGEWFADTPFRMGEKDGYLSIQGVLLYEVAELEQFNRSEVTAIKAFMSSTIDRFREPYGRRMKNMPRRCAFAATTNENEYFKDNTGNRRFWPVACGDDIDTDSLIRDRDQLFGEAIHMLNSGVLWYPTRDQQERLIDEHQESREITDPWAGRLYDYVEGLGDDGQRLAINRRDKVTVRELLTKGLGFELSKLGPAKAETMRVSAIMKKLKWAKGRDASGARERWYARPLSVAADAVTEVADDLPI
jgi:putative DNA primase/helicase